MRSMPGTYVSVRRGVHKGALGRIKDSGMWMNAHWIGWFDDIEFPNGIKVRFKHKNRPSYIELRGTKVEKWAKDVFKFAQRGKP